MTSSAAARAEEGERGGARGDRRLGSDILVAVLAAVRRNALAEGASSGTDLRPLRPRAPAPEAQAGMK